MVFVVVSFALVNANHSIESSLEKEEEILQLPMPGEVEASQSLEFGQTLALDHLGPIIINKDGSLRRITNWADLTTDEKKHTKRKVSLRNEKRLRVLKNIERLEIIRKYYEEQDRMTSMEEQNDAGNTQAAALAEDDIVTLDSDDEILSTAGSTSAVTNLNADFSHESVAGAAIDEL